MAELKQCQFCGGFVRVHRIIQTLDYISTACECRKCGMQFEYTQNFVYSKTSRVAISDSFEDVWNRRSNNE